MIERFIVQEILKSAKSYPVVTLTGPRQSGKTTLVRSLFPKKPYVSLESPDVRLSAIHDPRSFLANYPEGAVLDEVQRVPQLLSYIQTLVDENQRVGEYILTGSENFALLQGVTQSLAGRTRVLTLLPFSFGELRQLPDAPNDLWSVLFSGGYPRIYDQHIEPSMWHSDYVATYLQRDVRQITNIGDLDTFQTFLQLCAGRTAQLLNLSNLGADAGITHNTVKSWISVLQASYIGFTLAPYFRNLNKRLVKTPKFHFYDTGLICYLLGIREPAQLAEHPLRGAIFESGVVSEVAKVRAQRGLQVYGGLYFYRDKSGREIDLIIDEGTRAQAVEIKSGATIATDFFTHLDYFRKEVQNDPLLMQATSALVYGGNTTEHRHDTHVLSWRDVGLL